MKQAPNIYKLREILALADGATMSGGAGMTWVPARPLGYYSLRYRLKAAWLVFTGQADAVTWPSPEPPPEGTWKSADKCPECQGTGNLEDAEEVIYDCPRCHHDGRYHALPTLAQAMEAYRETASKKPL